ncbi:hypothetical protein TSUD_104270 [Trifolium subterraneum]|uniref:Uncharacterized protein n=1 Tax=Trifolium subterraneum TaxID=3900 RepID=A0A2Z6M6Y0_TRISU|nr:hypothetical protein TSUD_104270 [Trifolium subterraneum]
MANNVINAAGAIIDDDAGPDIPFTEEEISHWSIPWKHTLIVKTIGKENVSFQALENHLQRSWTRNGGTINVTDMEDGFISVQFTAEDDYNYVLFQGPWKVDDDCYLTLQRWRPLFSLTSENRVVVWIRILKLPMELCNKSFLGRIGSTLGVMLKVDDRLSCLHKFARICVELNLRRRLASHIMIRGYRVNLEYEGICGGRINEAREKIQWRIEECVENLIGERVQGVKTKELEICQVMDYISKEKHFERQVMESDLVLKQKYLESRMKELELKEKQHEDWMKKHESKKREFEGQVNELVSDLLSQQKHFESRMKELELKEMQHEGQVKELESKKKHFESQVTELVSDLVSQQKHFECRMKELELKEKQHENQVKEHESKTREFEVQVKELESKEKHFESHMMELVNDLASQQKHFEKRMEEVESKEKQHEDQVKEHESKKREIEDRVKELESIKKHFENQAKELESKYYQFVGQREKFISKVREYASQRKALVLKKKHFKIRMKEFESKEKVLESIKKHFESHTEELESKERQLKEQVKIRMKEFESKEKVLESIKKHFESQAEELKSKERQLKEQVKELESKEKQLDDRVKEFESTKRDSQDRVVDLRPGTDGHTLTVKVLSSELVKTIYSDSGELVSCTAECLVGDETGTIIFTARNEQVDLMEPGATVILENAKIDMFRGSMRLAVDKWEGGDIEVTEPANFEVRKDNNLSLERYLVRSFMVQSLLNFSLKIAVVDAKIFISGHF